MTPNQETQKPDEHASYVIAYNPVSGRKSSARSVAQIREQLVDLGHQVDVRQTNPPGPQAPIERHENDAQSILIVVGGDGTMAQLAQTSTRFLRTAFLGRGTANVLSIEFDLPKHSYRFIDFLNNARTTIKHAHGRINQSHPFLMMWSAGIDAEILIRTTQGLKNKLRKAAFVFSGIRALIDYTYPTFDVTCDQAKPIRGVWAIASRICHYGGPFRICPTRPAANQLMVLVYTKPGRWAALAMIWSIATGRIDQNKAFKRQLCQRVRLAYSDHKAPSQIDGDAIDFVVDDIDVSEESTNFMVTS